MSNTRTRFKLNALSLAILASTSMTYAYANEKEDEEEVEVIEVTGLKGSIIKSINDKKFASNILDSINAEDMGKNADQNIADALGRVTGVSVVSNNGEGSQITVRGAGANQNKISLNGMELSTTDFSQAVDLSSFSSDILSKLEVVKTPSADHEEGSLGASVNLKTVRPLNLKNDRMGGEIQLRYNDLSEKNNHKLQFSVVKRLFEETFGVSATVYHETNAYRKDEVRVDNYSESNVIAAGVDQNGNAISDFRAIEATGLRYQLAQNTSDRYGGTIGLHFLPTDDSELMFNLTYSKQNQERDIDAIIQSRGNQSNFIEGLQPLTNLTTDPAPFDDPLDWIVFNTETLTLDKNIGRFNKGSVYRSTGGSERDNLSSTLEWKQDLTDNLRMDAQIGYSSSKSESLPGISAQLQNWKQINNRLLFEAGEDIQPTGIDCTTGECQIVAGTHEVELNNILDYPDPENPDDNIPGWEDNIAKTGFNPADANAFQLGNLSESDVSVDDEILSAKLDFDYYLDNFGITTVEFGAKVTQREKFVDQQSYAFQSNATPTPIRDSEGNLLSMPGGPLTEIRASMFLDESGMDYDNVMESLGIERSNATTNWTTVNLQEAWDLVNGDTDVIRTPNNQNTRGTDIDTTAAYLKFNFSVLDDRLTGDFGVRYVETEIEASGYSGGTWHSFDQNALEAEFDWVTLSQLRDTSLPACPQPNWQDPANRLAYENKFNRIDGTGWDTSSGADPENWTRIPMFDPNNDGVQDACHDPEYALWASEVRAGETPTTKMDWVRLWRYADVSTTHSNGWDASLTEPNIELIGEPTGELDNYLIHNLTNKSFSSFPSVSTHSYENVLPSLNLNYAISEEFVARFAISKTMTRPELEETRAGFNVSEKWATYWGGGVEKINPGNIKMYNTKLDPLESNNLDLSLEWYFNKAASMSLALFSKDMKNFVDNDVVNDVYITDLRNISDTFDVSELILSTDENPDPASLEGCMPLRTTTQTAFSANDPVVLMDDPTITCHKFNITQKVNGTEAKVRGLELGYQQIYDFLPGILGGLGIQANYTYQDSEYGSQESSIRAGEFSNPYPVAETPEHTYNFTTFWEQDGHQVRLSYRGATDALVGIDWNTGLRGREWREGSLWKEGRDTLDLSASYKVNKNISINFQATNLTDAEYRTYFTSQTLDVLPVMNADGGYTFEKLVEGNPLEGNAPKSRTVSRYKVGTNYRLSLRVNF